VLLYFIYYIRLIIFIEDTISSFSAPSPPSMDIGKVLLYFLTISTNRFLDMDVDIQSDDELCLSQAMDDMSVFTRERSSSIISNFSKSFLFFKLSLIDIMV
jgi:hypothetical protein